MYGAHKVTNRAIPILYCIPMLGSVLRIRVILSRIRIWIPNFFIPDLDPGSGGEKAPDLGSRILLYIKIGMKNKTNFFLAFYSFRSKIY
jgi:hypothetical protein